MFSTNQEDRCRPWFRCFALSHCVRTEALRRRPHRSDAHTIIFPWLREGHPLLRRRRKTILIVVSFLSFLGCAHAEALQRRRHCIALCDCVLAPLAADVDVLVPCDCAPTLKEERRLFSWWGSFLLSPAGMYARIFPPASARAGDEPAKAFVLC